MHTETQETRRSQKVAVVIVTALVAAAVFAGCGSSDSSTSNTTAASSDAVAIVPASQISAMQSSGKTASELTAPPQVPKPLKPPCKIAALFAYNIEFFQNLGYGVQKEAKKLGCSVTIQSATGYGDTTNQVKQFGTAMVQRPSAIILHPADQKAMAPLVNQAWAQGIPVVYTEDYGPSKQVYAILTDDRLAGYRQGVFIGQHDKNAQVIAMCGPPGISWSTVRCNGLEEGLKSVAPNAKVVAKKFHAMDAATVASTFGSTLQAFPQANWAYNSTDLQANGVVSELKNLHKKPGEIKVTSLTIGREMLKNLKAGWVEMALAERPVLNGELAVDMAALLLQGVNPSASIWEPDHPEIVGKEGAAQFCGGSDCATDSSKGEAAFNWAPSNYKF